MIVVMLQLPKNAPMFFLQAISKINEDLLVIALCTKKFNMSLTFGISLYAQLQQN